jgi:4'-phosphopantetheinyl transferase
MRAESSVADAWRRARRPPLEAHAVHVWRVPLDDDARVGDYWALLSVDEQARASRFVREVHRRRFVVAHGALRTIVAGYVDERPEALEFEIAEHGKPRLRGDARTPAIEFNLSHSEDLALVAVSRARPDGGDHERGSPEVEHLELAERFFSPGERAALRALADAPEQIAAGFFAAWTRKEAYLKATGHGISRGLHHFDVALMPGEPARLIEDRLDAGATERWSMVALDPAPGYSGALVVGAPLGDVLRLAL